MSTSPQLSSPARQSPRLQSHRQHQSAQSPRTRPVIDTPPSARFVERPLGRRGNTDQASLLAPLPFNAGIAALVERFEYVMGPQVLPEDHADLMPETLRTGLKENLKTHGLHRETDYPHFSMHRRPPPVVRPAFDHCVFMVQPPRASDEGGDAACPPPRDLHYFCLPSKALAQEMQTRGYDLIHVTHLPNRMDRLPPPLEQQQQRTRGPPQATGHRAPSELRVPDHVPAFDQAGTAHTVASQLCTHFETMVVVTTAEGKEEVCASALPPRPCPRMC